MEKNSVHLQLVEAITAILVDLKEQGEVPAEVELNENTPLVGEGAVLDSRSLVVLLVSLEDYIEEEYGKEFDWTSDRAMSSARSPFRTPETLTEFVVSETGL